MCLYFTRLKLCLRHWYLPTTDVVLFPNFNGTGSKWTFVSKKKNLSTKLFRKLDRKSINLRHKMFIFNVFTGRRWWRLFTISCSYVSLNYFLFTIPLCDPCSVIRLLICQVGCSLFPSASLPFNIPPSVIVNFLSSVSQNVSYRFLIVCNSFFIKVCMCIIRFTIPTKTWQIKNRF